jgi:beta-mannosidase
VNDCLSLPLRMGAGGSRALTGWEAVWQSLGEGEAEGLHRGRGDSWEAIQVPAQQAASAGRQAIWYRTSFARPDHPGRILLRLGGAFLATNVWLNGRLLGSHYGYFAAFGFDLTPHLRADNLLVICCESAVETDLARKRQVMGFMNDGDSRPYPSSAFFSLPEPFRWEVPVGLWRPVELEYTGPVIFDWLHLKPRLDAGDVGRLDVDARLRNLDGREMAGQLALAVELPDQGRIPIRREFRLAGGLEQTLSLSISMPGARRWQPWRLGEAVLYGIEATVSVEETDSARVSDQFGFRELDWRAAQDGWSIKVGGQPFFVRGASYTPGYRLDRLRVEDFKRDLELARSANLDALRVHAHVLPEDFYRLADAAGMLVLADLPLTLGYAYQATVEQTRFFEEAVREHVREAVELLRNRPSVALWIAHDNPPWVASNADLADVHAVRLNHTVDQEAKARFERLDPGRTAIAASGEMDSHAYLGWRQGAWADFAELEPRFVSEFGAQSLPSTGSPVWDRLGRSWPVAEADPAWLYRGFEAPFWAERGAGLSVRHPSLDAYIASSQRYQAWLLDFAVGQLRKRKFESCWGALWYQLVDPFPAIGFSVLDHARVPKLALETMREAFRATRVIIDPVGFVARDPAGIGFRSDEPVTVRLVVVNDDPALAGEGSLRWSVNRLREPALGSAASPQGGLDRIRDAVRRKSYSGSIDRFELPRATEPAVLVASLNLPLAVAGEYRLEAELEARGEVIDHRVLEFEVGTVPPQPRWLDIPGYIAERLVAAGSVRAEPTGLSFAFQNRARPAVLTAVRGIWLDGHSRDPAGLLVEAASGRLPLPGRIELPLGRTVRFHLELGSPLGSGRHAVELDLQIPGVASGRVKVDGTVD